MMKRRKGEERGSGGSGGIPTGGAGDQKPSTDKLLPASLPAPKMSSRKEARRPSLLCAPPVTAEEKDALGMPPLTAEDAKAKATRTAKQIEFEHETEPQIVEHLSA